MSKTIYTRSLALAMISLVILICVLQYFVPPFGPLTSLKDEIVIWGVAVSSTLLIYGQVLTLASNVRRLVARKESRRRLIGSASLLAAFSLVIIGGLVDPKNLESGVWGQAATQVFYTYANTGIGGLSGSLFMWAAIRRFGKMRSVESLILFLVWLDCMMRNMSSLVFLSGGGVAAIADWIGLIPHAAANRAALAAIGVGELAIGVRAMMGKEPGLIEAEALK